MFSNSEKIIDYHIATKKKGEVANSSAVRRVYVSIEERVNAMHLYVLNLNLMTNHSIRKAIQRATIRVHTFTFFTTRLRTIYEQ